MTHEDAVRNRFGATAEQMAEQTAARVEPVREFLRRFLAPSGDERTVDVGTGAGVLALALAPLVREVVGVDVVPELLEAARRAAPPNVTFVEGDATRVPLESYSFDLACSRHLLHHVPRPELVIAELARLTRHGGRVLVEDQIAPADPLVALELDRFERARDPSHTRSLPDGDLRDLFAANGLVLLRRESRTERRDLEPYLDYAGCEGQDRERAKALAPGGGKSYAADLAWYLLAKR